MKPLPIKRYFEISFWGAARAFGKYSALRTSCEMAVKWLALEGRDYDASLIAHWIDMPAGFTCRHMPYELVLSDYEWNILSNALRQGGASTRGYDLARRYGEWHDA